MTVPSIGERTKLNGLQYLRAVAAIGVVAFHAAERCGYGFSIGQAGVDLFFALSGFLMVLVTRDNARPGPFLRDRVRRIVPSSWVLTTLYVVATLAGLLPHMRLAPWHIAASYFFLPATSPASGRVWPIVVPGWTLNYEMAFYLLFALSLAVRRRSRAVALLTAALAGLAATRLAVTPRGPAAVAYTDPILLEFAAGCWLGLWWSRGYGGSRRLGRFGLVAAAALLAAVAWSSPALPRVVAYGGPTLLLLASTLSVERHREVGRHPVPLLVGDASYSIYLWHGLGISVGWAAANRLGLPAAGALALCLAMGVGIGLGGYWCVERPLIRYFRRPRSLVPPGASATVRDIAPLNR